MVCEGQEKWRAGGRKERVSVPIVWQEALVKERELAV